MPISAGGRVVIAASTGLRGLMIGGLRRRRGNATRLGGSERWEAEMAETPLSSTETALENQRIGPLQIRVAAICTVVQMCDGYDVNSIGVTVTSLSHDWGLRVQALITAFLWA